MSFRFACLGSGSGGNSVLVEAGEGLFKTRILVDAGLSAKQLDLRLGDLGVKSGDLDAILLTHEHGDHVRGLRVFLKKYPVPVYATPMTREVVREKLDAGQSVEWRVFEQRQSFTVGEVEIRGFPVPHDAVDPCGFVMTVGDEKVGVATDFGYVTGVVKEALRGVRGLFVEANYDEGLLEKDMKRPWATKQRIASRHGHLSNVQVVEFLRELKDEGLEQVVLGHLSSDCNCERLLGKKIEEEVGVGCVISGQDEVTPWVAV